MRTNAYIDAANLFYGGEKSLGWRIDYKKFLSYLRTRYGVQEVFFFAGVDIHTFSYDYLANESVPLEKLGKYLTGLVEESGRTEKELSLFTQYLKRVRFYLKLQEFGYTLVLKPVKIFPGPNGRLTRKANCDVDMAFYILRDYAELDRILFLSGDGDFLPILKYLRRLRKEVMVFARGVRTAKEIRQFAGDQFTDFTKNLRPFIEMTR